MNDRQHRGLLLAVATAVISGMAAFVYDYGVRAVGDAAAG